MCVTIGSGSAGEASFIMNFIILICIMFTGECWEGWAGLHATEALRLLPRSTHARAGTRAGFLVNIDSIPAFLRWIHYLSIFFYAFEAMITNEMTGRTFSFNVSGVGRGALPTEWRTAAPPPAHGACEGAGCPPMPVRSGGAWSRAWMA